MITKPEITISCDNCGYEEEVELITTVTYSAPRCHYLYRIPHMWELDWFESNGKQYCQDCWDELYEEAIK